jgi:hypothetical protein
MKTSRALGVVICTAVAGCGGPAPPPFRPVADLKQLMTGVVEPAAETYWDAVGSIIDEQGVTEIAPATAEEWEAVTHSAYQVTESGNLMMMSPRARDGGDWMTFSRALVDVGQRAIRAAEARDKQAVFDVGGEIYDACTNCHAKYAVELQRPNTQ